MPAARRIMPLAVSDTSAAAMLDMSAAEFRRLVQTGELPPPARIGTLQRWRVDDLNAILDGSAALPEEDFEL